MNTEFAKQDKEDFYLYKLRDVVLQEKAPTLLNFNCMCMKLQQIQIAFIYTLHLEIASSKISKTKGNLKQT